MVEGEGTMANAMEVAQVDVAQRPDLVQAGTPEAAAGLMTVVAEWWVQDGQLQGALGGKALAQMAAME